MITRFPNHPIRQFLAVVLVALFLSGVSCVRSSELEPRLQKPAPNTSTWLDLSGHGRNPFDGHPAKAIVFLFISTDCPISNRYAPEIRRLHDHFASQGVRFWLVYHDPDLTIEAIRRHLNDYDLPAPVLRDPKHTLVKKAKVRVTPEAAVFLPDQKLVYHGRIDDWYVDFGKQRPSPTRHDLQEVLQAMVDGRPVPQNATPAVGCYIPDLP